MVLRTYVPGIFEPWSVLRVDLKVRTVPHSQRDGKRHYAFLGDGASDSAKLTRYVFLACLKGTTPRIMIGAREF